MDSTPQTVLFPNLFSKPVVTKLDQEHSSSDGGGLLLKAVDDRLGLTEALASCLPDDRDPGKVRHSVLEILRQRVFAIALGYPDGNDADGLAEDPIHRLLLERDPIEGHRLPSQPTISRFENAPRRQDLYRMSEVLADTVIARHRRRLRGRCRRITLDIDPTDDPTHGQQELSFYHGYYDTHCYLPLVGTMTFNDEKEQHLFMSVLRPGNSSAHSGVVAILSRVLDRLLSAFPDTRILVRLDGGFGAPVVLDFLDKAGVDYVVGLGATKPLKKRASGALSRARRLFRENAKTTSVFGDTLYKTKTTWPHRRRVIYKAEVVEYPGRKPRDNVRFVVTNLHHQPEKVYGFYTDRGDTENRIKELKNDMAMDRTSCTKFRANQFRVLLTSAAYVLMQELRRQGRHSECRRAQVNTLRNRLLKIAAWVEISVRRVVVHLPRSFPGRPAWMKIAAAAGGLPS
ncbi:MAG: IS1380 family transposase [Planctomycetota bacterium]